FSGAPVEAPTRRDLLDYIRELSEELARTHPDYDALLHIQRMKKTLVYICDGMAPEFGQSIRRMKTPAEFGMICAAHLDCDDPLPCLPSPDSRLFCGFGDLFDGHSASGL